MVNPDRPWPRPETPRAPLDATSSETLELWAAQPEWDTRSIEEFAAEGGRPIGPPNRIEGGPPVWAAFFSWVWGLPWLLVQLFRPRRSRWNDDEMPELPRFVPAPCPPSTPMLPRAPIGGTGQTDRHGRVIPPKPTYRPPAPPAKTGTLRASLGKFYGRDFDEIEIDSRGRVMPMLGGVRLEPIRREDRRALRDELPPVYPDLDDSDDGEPRGGTDSTGAR